MSRRKKDPLRPLTDAERDELAQLSRSRAAPAVEVARATMLLAVARGDGYQAAARAVGRRSGDAVPHRVARFNAEGLAALAPRHGGGRRPTDGPGATGRIVAEAVRAPTPEGDGAASGSLTTPRRSLRAAPDGLPRVSTYTIRRRLRAAGASSQRRRTWCPTGTAPRRREAGPAVVTDPDAGAKRGDRGRLPAGRGHGAGGPVHRPGRALPGDPLPGPLLAARGRPGPLAARVPASGDGQGPGAVPTRRRPRPPARCDGRPQRGPAPLAQAAAGRGPGRHARPARRARRGVACGLGTLAGGPLDQADPALGAAAAADAPGAR